MKKYISSLVLLFVVHNLCAMELDPFDRCFKYDEKCRLVAKYLHKYPKGKNEYEAKAIEHFFHDQPERLTVLPLCVTKYKNFLDNIEAEQYLRSVYTELPIDLKKRIFTEALWYPAREYYSTYNVLKFMAMQQPDWVSQPYNTCLIHHFYKPYFLDEIDEKDASIVFNIVDDSGIQDAYGRIITDFGHEIIKSKSRACYSNGRWLKDIPYKCAKKTIEELISFLDGKNARVDAFKAMFNEHIKHLTLMDGESGVNRFVELLTLFKDLTQRAIVLHTGKVQLGLNL